MFPNTTQRVPEHTAEEVNEQIHEQIRDHIALYGHCSPELIERRLKELDAEWDIERVLELNASVLATTAITFALFGKKSWLLLAGVVTVFLGQHAIQGWCPPVPLLRRLGFRTEREIDIERYALKALRGDFKGAEEDGQHVSEEKIEAVLSAAR